MLVLAIETSCDETALALIEMSGSEPPRLLCELISSQIELHQAYGGVVPELAAREHMRNLPLLYDELHRQSRFNPQELDGIGVTRGPGLKGCLLMGFSFAKGLALAHQLKLIGVNHIEGHLLAPRLDHPDLDFPYLALVVSGGHTEILEVRAVGDYTLWGRTKDDAAGEAFDKSAQLLGLPYPGGPQLAQLADGCEGSPFELPRVMRSADGFSFSGLKTAARLLVREHEAHLSDELIRGQLAYAIQSAIVDALVFKLKRAVRETGISKVAVSGGVSANRALREATTALTEARVFFPALQHCTDNAAMIAYAAGLRLAQGQHTSLDAGVHARWPVEQVGTCQEVC